MAETVNEKEIWTTLQDIGDLKGVGVDRFGAKFFNSAWSIVKHDLIDAVKEFFDSERMHSAINNTLVTLIQKKTMKPKP